MVVPEVQRWVNKWKKEDVSTVPSSAIEALCACHADIYPNVYILLTILGTLPESTAPSERSFSTARRLKPYLRSSIGNELMTGLALLSIHKDRQYGAPFVKMLYLTDLAQKLQSMGIFRYLCAHLAISAQK